MFFIKVKWGHFYVAWFLKILRSFDQITTLTYVLMDNFCPCLVKTQRSPFLTWVRPLLQSGADWEISTKINTTKWPKRIKKGMSIIKCYFFQGGFSYTKYSFFFFCKSFLKPIEACHKLAKKNLNFKVTFHNKVCFFYVDMTRSLQIIKAPMRTKNI